MFPLTSALRQLLSVTGTLCLLLATHFSGFAQSGPPPQPPPPTSPNGLRWSWGTALDHPTLNGMASHSALVVDAAGNQYVTGSFTGKVAFGSTTLRSRSPLASDKEMYVAKLSPTGQWLWAVGTGSATSTSKAADIALDAQGRVVVAGFFSGSLTLGGSTFSCPAPTSGVVVARLSAQGQWLSAAAGIVTSGLGMAFAVRDDYGHNMLALDAQGNALITGQFAGDIAFGNYPLTNPPTTQFLNYIASLSAATNTWQWAKLIGGNTQDLAQVTGVATGTQGDIWVTGQFRSVPLTLGTTVLQPHGQPGTSDVFLGHLSATGQWLDASRVGGTSSEQVTQIVVDGQDNLYLTGSFYGATSFGNVTISTPNSQLTGYMDAFLAKRNASGQWEWALAGGGTDDDTGNELVVDAQGEVYWTGSCFPARDMQFGPTTISFGATGWPPLIFLSKISPTGQWRWTQAVGKSLSGYGLAITPQGQAYMAANYAETPPFNSISITGSALSDVAVGQVSAQGALSFTAHTESGGTAFVTNVIHDDQGNSYATGYFTGTLILGGTPLQVKRAVDAFVVKLNRQGAVQWALQVGAKGWEEGTRLALDGQGGLILLGGFNGDSLRIANTTLLNPYWSTNPYQNGSGFLAHISPQGQWVSAMLAPPNVWALQVEATGALTIAGSFMDTLRLGALTVIPTGGTDGYIARLSATNQWQWVKHIGTPSFDMVADIVLDSAGDAYVLGVSGDTLTLGTTTLLPRDAYNMYVARLSAAGQWQWAKPVSSSPDFIDKNRLTLVPGRRHLLLNGLFTDTITLGVSHLRTRVNYLSSAFVGAMDFNGQWLWGMMPGGDGSTFSGQVTADRYGTGYMLGGVIGAARFGADSISSRPGRRTTSPAPFLPGAHLRGGPPFPPGPLPFIAAFTEPGQWQWGELAMGATTISTSAEGDLYMGGTLGGYGSIYYWPTNLDSTFTVGGFRKSPTVLSVGFVTAKLNGPTGLSDAASARPTFGLWPNPAHHSIQLMDLPKGAATVRILNAVGAVVMQQTISGNPAAVTLKLPNLVPGLYVVQCGGASRRLVVE